MKSLDISRASQTKVRTRQSVELPICNNSSNRGASILNNMNGNITLFGCIQVLRLLRLLRLSSVSHEQPRAAAVSSMMTLHVAAMSEVALSDVNAIDLVCQTHAAIAKGECIAKVNCCAIQVDEQNVNARADSQGRMAMRGLTRSSFIE